MAIPSWNSTRLAPPAVAAPSSPVSHRLVSAKCPSIPPAASVAANATTLPTFTLTHRHSPGDLPASSSIATPSIKPFEVASIKGDE
jgi:hypothetical protein